jgi:hypothetical protein
MTLSSPTIGIVAGSIGQESGTGIDGVAARRRERKIRHIPERLHQLRYAIGRKDIVVTKKLDEGSPRLLEALDIVGAHSEARGVARVAKRHPRLA